MGDCAHRNWLEDVTIHDFRRTFSTYLNAIGIGAFTLAAILGHKVPNFDVTSIYAQPDREKMKEAIDSWKPICRVGSSD